MKLLPRLPLMLTLSCENPATVLVNVRPESQNILKKMGSLTRVACLVVFFFVALRIFGNNITNLVLTWVRPSMACDIM